MTYLSVCSGIEAATVAWEPLGFKPVGFAEIEPFPCELLKQKYPTVKNYGDITNYKEWDYDGKFDILVGGTPCQSFSIAGKRGGTDDIRGRLMYSYLDIVGIYKPQWVIWENVPGVLSSGKGLDFASFLSGLEEYGYGWAYRVLDAQYFGVPQRRRRVFVIGHSDNRTDLAAKVLFEPQELRTFTKTGKEEKQEIAGTLTTGFDCDTILNNQLAVECYAQSSFGGYREGYSTLTASGGEFGGGSETIIKEGKTIRRLTPLECERLQGFPDNYTQIEWKGKPKDQCPDSHRYKAIGNSMAVPVMRWIGERIKMIEGRNEMYKDKDGFEHEDFKDIDAYESSVICPCCGDIQNPDIELDVLQCPPVELECLVCGCVFEADFEVVFSTVCKKYRTDGKEK